MLIKELLSIISLQLNSKRDAEELLCELLSCSRGELLTRLETPCDAATAALALNWATRHAKGEPLAYISGKREFYGCNIAVNSHTLIPRQETELLVDCIVETLKKENLAGKELWDMCCGSGCIGIALKKAFPALSVTLSDCSPEAIALAEQNAANSGVSVETLIGDLFTPFQGRKCHYFICNPPYITEGEYLHLDKTVKDFEPKLALVAGSRGTEFYEQLAFHLPQYLHPGAKVWFEIGYTQGESVSSLFQGRPWRGYTVKNDWAGHNRFFFLEIE